MIRVTSGPKVYEISLAKAVFFALFCFVLFTYGEAFVDGYVEALMYQTR